MNKLINFLIAGILALSLNSCEKVIGQGPLVTEERSVAAFTMIEAEFPGDVVLVQGASPMVKAQARENIINDLYTTVDNGILKIKLRNGLRLTTGTSLKVYVTIPVIKRISLMGSGNVTADQVRSSDLDIELTGSGNMVIGKLEADNVYGELSGSGNMTFNGGSTRYLAFRLTGSGDLRAEHFSAVDAELSLTGSGSATVRASNTLKAVISGSGNINYYGNPEVTKNVTGSGRLKKKD